MTAQLSLDFTLPATACSVEQRAVVFTVARGEFEGRQTYREVRPGGETAFVEALAAVGGVSDARVMVRTVTVGEWRDA